MSTGQHSRATGAVVIGSDYKALGVVRSLGRHGVPVAVLRDEHLLAERSRYCGRTFTWPAAAEAEKVAYLLDLASRHGLRGWTIFPTEDETAALLARNRAVLSDAYRLTIQASWETLRWAYDKRLTYRLAADLDLDHPRTAYPRGREDVLGYAGPYPAILKPATRAELNRFTISKAWPAPDAATLITRYDDACTLIDPSLIMIQEQIPGGGESQFSYAAICREGRPVASLVARRLRQWPMDFGRASTYVETIDNAEVEATALRLLDALRFNGVVEVEFKRDARDGRLKLLDINPRVWGWHTLGQRAGVDFSYLLWQMAQGTDVPAVRGRPGIRWVRALTDVPTVIREIRAGRLSMSAYVRSLTGPIEFAMLAPDDLVPSLLEVPAAVALAVARRRGKGKRSTRDLAGDLVGAVPSVEARSR
jgi:D-aspartate ligase